MIQPKRLLQEVNKGLEAEASGLDQARAQVTGMHTMYGFQVTDMHTMYGFQRAAKSSVARKGASEQNKGTDVSKYGLGEKRGGKWHGAEACE